MRTRYQVWSGGRPISLQDAYTAHEAVIDYLRAFGCDDGEINRVAPDAVTWRGAVYTGVPTSEAPERSGQGTATA